MKLVVDGKPWEGEVEPGERLLDVLRERCGVTSVKDGCAPQATCGCCTVLVDGEPKLSCALAVEKVADRAITTLDGLPADARERLAAAFVSTGALQCGFCTPGIMVRAHALLERDPAPAASAVCDALKSHLCRCTGYTKIVEGIQSAGTGEVPARTAAASGRVGTSLARYEGRELALGQRPYIADMLVPGLLEGALRLARVPRAKVVAIDTSPALAMDGVIAVVTAADVPGQRCQGLIHDDWPVLVAIGEEVRCVGDALAVVAARTRRIARRAAAAIRVTLEALPPVTDPEEALKAGAPRVQPAGNLLSTSVLKRGDAEAALAASAHVVEETFQTQFIEHAFLEPESALVVPPAASSAPPRWTLYTPGQGVADDRRQVASLLAIPEDELIVELVSNGGAFGGKEDLGVQGHAALLAHVTRQPCRVTLSREESILTHPKRHPIKMHYRVGCDAAGNLTAVQARLVGDKGAYASVGSKVLERACGHATGAYRVPHVDVTALAVHTNNPPCGAMRGFGANQVAFAIEGCVDRLAAKVGLDGWEMRWRNALDEGDRFGTGQKLVAVGLKQTLLAVREAYRGARYAGIACGIKNVGIGNGMPDAGQAVLEVRPGGKVRIYTGFTEMGQGLFTVLIQTAVEETGLAPGVFEVEASTRAPVPCGMTTASRGTVLACNATQRAARALAGALAEGRLETMVGRRFHGEWVCDWTTALDDPRDEPRTHLTYGFATQVVVLDEQGRLARVIAAHDVGRVMNPVLLEGQIEGSVHMGLGMALTEELPVVDGVPKVTHLGQLGVLRAHHMPEVQCVFIEENAPDCPYGAKGVGEIGLVPTAGAVAGALQAFDGRFRTRLPMKDSAAAEAIVGRARSRG